MMSTKIAINGLGRIGRAILRRVLDEPTLELAAVNDLIEVENLAYLLRFDTVYGRYSKPVVVEAGDLSIAGHKLRTEMGRKMNQESHIRVLSVDDHPLQRGGIAMIINNEPDM